MKIVRITDSGDEFCKCSDLSVSLFSRRTRSRKLPTEDHSKMCAYWLLSKVNADLFSIASEEIANEIPAQCIGSQNLRIGIRKILVKGVLNLLRRAF